MGDETLYQELPPTHAHKHTYVHTHRSKKVIFVSIYSNEIAIVLSLFIIDQRVIITPSFFSVSQSSLKHPRLALPEAFHHAPAVCGMAIREQT